MTACAGSCVRRRCWVPEGSGSVLLSCVCVLTRNYAATQRFHKLNIHSFMPERPHKRICPEITQYTFRCPCQNELAQRLRNTTFIVCWLPDSLGPEPTWHPYKVPVLRLPPQPRAFRHHAFANVVQHLQRLYGLVVIEAVGELSQADSAWPSTKESVVTYGS